MSLNLSAHFNRKGSRILTLRTFIIFLLLGATSWNASVFAAPRDESAVKAAFVLNFAMLTEWPETAFSSPDAAVKLCVVGGRTLPRAFNSIEGKMIGKRPLHVTAVDLGVKLPDCQIVYYRDEVDTENLVRTLNAVRGKPVLTVGEKESTTRLGGAIHFYRERGKIRFSIKPKIVDGQGIKLSSRLLKTATLIDN